MSDVSEKAEQLTKAGDLLAEAGLLITKADIIAAKQGVLIEPLPAIMRVLIGTARAFDQVTLSVGGDTTHLDAEFQLYELAKEEGIELPSE